MTVVIAGGRIAEMGVSGNIPVPKNAQVIDAIQWVGQLGERILSGLSGR
jgi:imidazolonepropionase-like amidohydrolase